MFPELIALPSLSMGPLRRSLWPPGLRTLHVQSSAECAVGRTCAWVGPAACVQEGLSRGPRHHPTTV
eukprot:14580683-Alexandrium_andersonii.AAC.1